MLSMLLRRLANVSAAFSLIPTIYPLLACQAEGMKRAAVIYFAADFVSLVGNSAIGLALPWLVLIRTGDAAAAGVVAAATAIPAFVAAVAGGSLVDRFGRRTVAVVADLGSAASVALLFVVDETAGLTIASFIGLGVLGALFDVPGMTARQTMLPEIAEAGGLSLDRASSIRQALFGLSFLVGPALAGVALAALPAASILIIIAGCSAAAAVLTALLPGTLNSPGESTPPLRHLRQGFTAMTASPIALATTLVGIGSVFAISPLQAVVLPVIFEAHDQPLLFGLTMSSFAVGLISGSLLYGRLRVPRRRILIVALLSALVGLTGFTLVPIAGVLPVWAVLVGAGYGLIGPLVPVLISERVPAEVRGRVLGLQNAGYLAAFPLGALVVGFIVQGHGVQLGAAVSLCAWAVCVIYALLAPGLRDLEPPAREVPVVASPGPSAT